MSCLRVNFCSNTDTTSQGGTYAVLGTPDLGSPASDLEIRNSSNMYIIAIRGSYMFVGQRPSSYQKALLVYGAVSRSRLQYGLESTH